MSLWHPKETVSSGLVQMKVTSILTWKSWVLCVVFLGRSGLPCSMWQFLVIANSRRSHQLPICHDRAIVQEMFSISTEREHRLVRSKRATRHSPGGPPFISLQSTSWKRDHQGDIGCNTHLITLNDVATSVCYSDEQKCLHGREAPVGWLALT
jgi:hypothetical protein